MTAFDPIHLIGVLVAVALFYQSIQLVQKRKESVLEFLLWTGMGGVILILSVSSAVTVLGILDAIQVILAAMGFQSGRDGVFVLAILSLLLLLFYTYINAKTNRKELADLNQEIALLRFECRKQRENDTRKFHD